MTETVLEAAAGPHEEEAPFRSPDAVRLAGITYRQLDYWTRQGWLCPGVNFQGSGSNREWPPGEIEIARRMGLLVAAGFRPEHAAALARPCEGRHQLAPGVWLEFGPALSDLCSGEDHGACFPDEPSDCGCECHGVRDA